MIPGATRSFSPFTCGIPPGRSRDQYGKSSTVRRISSTSRIASHISRQQQTHRLRHVVSQLVRHLPDDVRKSEAVRELASYGCVTQMHVVRLLAPRLKNENHTKDIDFSPWRAARPQCGHSSNPHGRGNLTQSRRLFEVTASTCMTATKIITIIVTEALNSTASDLTLV